VPNIITIDKIDKLLDGRHPDGLGDVKFRFKMGLFLAKAKKDPLTKAFLHGSLMEKAYDFDIPEDLSEIPEGGAEECEREKGKARNHANFTEEHGMRVPYVDPV